MDLGLGNSIIFLLKAMFFGIATIVSIPKNVYKKFFIWGFLFGGIGDVTIVTLLGPGLKLLKYQNMGMFDILGTFSFWTPLAWMFTFMIFFYFLPVHRYFYFIYIGGFSIFGFMVGLVLQNIGLFKYEGAFIYFAPFVFMAWFMFSSLIYFRYNRITLK